MPNPIDVEIYKKWQKSPRSFICDMWKLEVERDNSKFIKGKHITWQQDDILQAVEDALLNKKVRRIAVKSGHGIGKSTTLAWLILWFLFCYLDAQIPCTAPTENQMYDVLWKELAKWLKMMPEQIQGLYEWTNTYIRIRERPETWFARAKTARKEAPEALAGVHGDFVMFVIDEACHDDKTEVLTENSWKLFKDLLSTDKVGCWKDGKLIFELPVKHYEFDHDGLMYVGKKRGTDFVVTPNHRMLYRSLNHHKNTFGEWKFKEIKDIQNDVFLPRNAYWEGSEPNYSHDWFRFLGWYFSEGSLGYGGRKEQKAYSVVISQDKPENKQDIYDLCQRLNLNPKLVAHGVKINNVKIATELAKFGKGCFGKKVPDYVKNSTPDYINCFLETYLLGDGFIKNGREIYYTSSNYLANDLQELIIKTGGCSSVTIRKLKDRKSWIKDHYAVSTRDGFVVSRYKENVSIKINKDLLKTKYYKGKVYCVSVPSGVLLTRRNGYCLFSGNSGVPEEIFNTAEGALTNKDILVIMISNPTRLIGYFYGAFHKDGKNWQQLSFNSQESPVVDKEFVSRISEKHGENSDEYKIRVLGEFPSEEGIDDKGFVSLFTADEIKFTQDKSFVQTRMGIDPSGEGQDETAWAVRDDFKGGIVGTERTSNPKSIAEKTLTLMEKYGSQAKNVSVDNFGVGANVAQEIALTPFQYKVNGINVGEKSKEEIYLNTRAEAYYAIKSWFRKGGSLIDDENGHKLKEELLTVKFKRNLQGKIQIMSKDEMRKQGIASPNKADAFMLTFTNIKPLYTEAVVYIPGQMQANPQHRQSYQTNEAQVFYPRL